MLGRADLCVHASFGRAKKEKEKTPQPFPGMQGTASQSSPPFLMTHTHHFFGRMDLLT